MGPGASSEETVEVSEEDQGVTQFLLVQVSIANGESLEVDVRCLGQDVDRESRDIDASIRFSCDEEWILLELRELGEEVLHSLHIVHGCLVIVTGYI